jgi:D-glycero-alpha-D-manno-heptose-7-phosphate kinase
MTWDGELALPRAVLHEFGVERGVSIFLASEVPPGTGLGSSSAVAVALIQATAAYLCRPLDRQQIAELACRIELEKLGAPIGKQDQFAAAFGGLNLFRFENEGVGVEPVSIPGGTLGRLERRLMLFFTGTAHDSAAILREQTRATTRDEAGTLDRLHRIKAAVADARRCLERGDLDGIGKLLDEGWRQKRAITAGISTDRIDECYALALEAGALGGKITGAGGGGFMLLYCHEERQDAVTHALETRGLRRMDFHFERKGVSVGAVHWADPAAATPSPAPLAVAG